MRRRIALALFALALLLPSLAYAENDAQDADPDASIQDGVYEWLDSIDWGKFESALNDLPREVRLLWDGFGALETAKNAALGESGRDGRFLGRVVETLKQMLQDGGKSFAGLFVSLIGISLIGAFASTLSDEKKGVGEAASFITRCFALTLLISVFIKGAEIAISCASSLCAFMEIAAPAVMTLLVAMGCSAGAGVFEPAFALLSSGVASVMKTLIVPLALCGGVLGLFSHLSSRVTLSEMSALVKSAIKWTIGAVTTLYLGVTSVRGMSAAAFDAVSVRAAKYAAGSAAPMVGSLVGGVFDTMLGCACLVKNAVGLTSILLAACIALTPVVQLAAYILILRLSAALVQPVADEKLTKMFRTGADMLSTLLSACVASASMFIVTMGLITGMGNGGYWG